MVRHGGTPALPAASHLPVAHFEKVDDVMKHARDTKLTRILYSYGYADDAEFTRPESYMQYIEPLESELAVQVEYDMDEQDREWLELVNKQRKADPSLDQIGAEIFEVIMDRLEKEWFNLTKNIPKPDFALPSEDSTCAVCDDSEGENSNAIVFCDGCNLAVHQDCYGIPYVPEGQWLCRKCTVAPDSPVSCLLCPNEGGAFKQTTNGDWVHLLCAIWVPETRVANEVFMEPITGVERISKQRWKLNCSICRVKEGACIQCAKTQCFLAFHVTCARKERLLSAMKSAHGTEPAVLTCHCERHLPKEQADAREAAIAAEEAEEENNPGHTGKSSKSARAYTKGYKPGPPIVPAIIVNNIRAYTEKAKMRKHVETIQMICRYWSLKREKRRGAPLLKRLHLEPWTASASGKIQTEEEQRMKLDQMHRLLNDLVKLKETSWHIAQRETAKLEQAKTIEEILDVFLLHREKALWDAFAEIKKMDNRDHFLNPVNRHEVPDYFEIIKQPMCWMMIETKLTKHEYSDIEPFIHDINLVVNNAILYNRPGTPFQKVALKIQGALDPIFAKLYAAVDKEIPSDTPDEMPQTASTEANSVGDFEPSSDCLELLISRDAIADEMPIIMTDDPLDFLFKFDLAKDKPAPPRPPPKPRDRTSKSKKKEAKKKEKEKEAQEKQNREMTVDAYSHPEPIVDLPAEPDAGPGLVQELGAESTLESKKQSQARKRQIPSTGQEPVPMVEEVDNQQSFKLFEKGWILPPDSRRHNRAPVDRASSVPRPKKRSRNEPGPQIPEHEPLVPEYSGEASLSQVETTNSDENIAPAAEAVSEAIIEEPEAVPRTLIGPGIPPDPGVESTVFVLEPLPAPSPPPPPPTDEDVLESQITQPPSSTVGPPLDQLQRVVEENGKVILETLDTPSIRREKAMARKRQLAAQESISGGHLIGPGTLPEAGFAPPHSPNKGSGEGEFEPVSDTDRAKATRPPPSSKISKKRGVPVGKVPYPRLKAGGSSEAAELIPGTLVWAKASTYPWWPASIYEDNDPSVSKEAIRRMGQLKARDKPGAARRYVRFFDRTMSWETPLLEHMRMLGEDNSFDEAMLAKQSPYQPSWKSQRDECLKAYQVAMREIETASEGGPDNSEGPT